MKSLGNWYPQFFQRQVLLFHQIPILWYASAHGKYMGLPINIPQHWKIQRIHPLGTSWETDTHTFPKVCVVLFHQIPILWFASSQGKCIGLLINIPQHWKRQQNPSYGKSLGNWYPYFSQSIGAFIPSDSYPMVHFITWKMHWTSKSHVMGKCSKTHPAERVWDIGTNTFRKVRAVLFHQISILWYVLSYEKCLAFSVNFSQHVKMQHSPSHGENWNIDAHTFSESMAIPFLEISTLWYSTLHEKCLGFLTSFS